VDAAAVAAATDALTIFASSQNRPAGSWRCRDRPAAPSLDFVFTVCDRAAKEACPCGRVNRSPRMGTSTISVHRNRGVARRQRSAM